MKPVAIIAVSVLLTGCSAMEGSDYALYYQMMRESFAVGFGGTSRITKAEAAAVPYASIGYRVDDGEEQLLVLATDVGGEQLWTSGSHVVLVTRAGRIVRTVGLAHDVSAVTPKGSGELANLADATATPIRSVRFEDLPDVGAYGVPVSCLASSGGLQTIAILGQGISTIRVNERCNSPTLNWSFTDSYWIEPKTGRVWRSIQHLNPKDGKIEIELLRPPA